MTERRTLEVLKCKRDKIRSVLAKLTHMDCSTCTAVCHECHQQIDQDTIKTASKTLKKQAWNDQEHNHMNPELGGVGRGLPGVCQKHVVWTWSGSAGND